MTVQNILVHVWLESNFLIKFIGNPMHVKIQNSLWCKKAWNNFD